MPNVQILTFMPKKIEFLFRKKFKHASRAKNSKVMDVVTFFSSQLLLDFFYLASKDCTALFRYIGELARSIGFDYIVLTTLINKG